MCGIFGIYAYREPRQLPMSLLHEANRLMAHRGPDDCGIYSDPSSYLHLSHRRLSILDVSSSGRQPMASPDGRLVVTYNGEIYNYLEIREVLKSSGHEFRSTSDTEVLLHAYEEWGIGCLSRFNGMFAFGLWDRSRRKLYLVRDRLGIKPLYYFEDRFGIAFASEVKAFKAIPGFRFSADERYVSPFLREGFVTGEETMFRGIRKLLPGHYMEVDSGGAAARPYWNLSFEVVPGRSEEEWVEELEALLEESVDLRLRSDVPVGMFLSGGLDSTAIVALLSGKSDAPVKTFSVAYDLGREYDETPFARKAASRYGTDHHEYFVTPDEFRDFIPGYVWHMEEPVSEAPGISLYYIARLAREHVTVILSGEGSDEVFGGYYAYPKMLALESYRKLPVPLRRLIGSVGNKVLPRGSRGRNYLELGALPLDKRYRGANMLHAEALGNLDAGGRWAGRSDPVEPVWERVYSESRGWTPLNRLLHADTKTWLVDDILVKADKMTMANSLELRVPFLDYRLVEKAASMPSDLKIRGGTKKYILKKMMAGRVPEEIIRRKKMGFPTPIGLMFRDCMNGYLKDILLDARTVGRGLFPREGVEKTIASHERGSDRSQLLWRLLVLEEWFRVFVDA